MVDGSANERQVIASERVLLGGGESPHEIAPALIEIEASAIAAVHQPGERGYGQALRAISTRPEVTAVHDFGRRLVTPAFVNAHTHLALTFLRSVDPAAERDRMVEDFFFEIEAKLCAEDVRAFTRMGAYESLLCGVGQVYDHYYFGEAVADGLVDVGLSGVVAPTLQDLNGPGVAQWQQQLAATERIAQSSSLRERGIVAALGPHATDTVSEALWRRSAEVATRLDLPIHCHLAQSPEEVERAQQRHGTSPLGWLHRLGVLEEAPSWMMAHAIFASVPELDRLDRARHRLVWCPASASIFAFGAQPQRWAQLGLGWAVGTDCAASNDSMDVQQELRLIAAQRSAAASWSTAYGELLLAPEVSAQQARRAYDERQRGFAGEAEFGEPAGLLRRIWAEPGTWHPGLRSGIIAEGALANVLVWDEHHPAIWPARDPLRSLAMAHASRAMWALFVAGRQVGSSGNVASILETDAYREARDEASARLNALLER